MVECSRKLDTPSKETSNVPIVPAHLPMDNWILWYMSIYTSIYIYLCLLSGGSCVPVAGFNVPLQPSYLDWATLPLEKFHCENYETKEWHSISNTMKEQKNKPCLREQSFPPTYAHKVCYLLVAEIAVQIQCECKNCTAEEVDSLQSPPHTTYTNNNCPGCCLRDPAVTSQSR